MHPRTKQRGQVYSTLAGQGLNQGTE
uniref:Uncharacterized protein n=1 Tax=Rhizophora mucronata TaxID=61149 RepID=A0A2P2PDY5_RHIMU